MPLRKLWNSICGRTHGATENTAAADPAAAPSQPERQNARSAASTPAAVQPAATAKATATASKPIAAAKPVVAAPARNILGFGARPVEPALCKLLKPLNVGSLLEVGVDDGSRALAIVSTLQASHPETKLRYCAIDAFEMGDGPVTLMQFHQRVRGEGVCPQIFPDSIENGLIRVCHTVGRVDVVVLGVSVERWKNPNTIAMLRRVCHPETIVFYNENGKWDRFADTEASTAGIRKAA
ncbi:hypothetical protein Pla52o_31840 [Novipirellula galeiformis]|uniref:Methyltransferase domain protein n=1 Tax=Novipirellula galeiformis TaxID=2528004 RepID=A0A5C6CFW9_9BACT|nr:hypothetical protein [Novipirellula galeiformis]TWU22136.1 hypothetical protein Pla52o_31840 [Novipirellula galeiformis]